MTCATVFDDRATSDRGLTGQMLTDMGRHGRDFLRQFTEAVTPGVVVVDDSGTVVLCNRQAQEVLDRDATDTAGAPLGFPVVSEGTTEIEIVTRVGTIRAIEMQVTATACGPAHAYIAVLREVSERRMATVDVTNSEEPRNSSACEPDVIAMIEDLTELERAQGHPADLALHDELTGLANRSLAMDRLEVAQARAERAGTFVGLLFVDLDRFQAVNERLGHDAGDALLIEVARRLESVLRPSDTAARIGGDEFVVCCDSLGTDEQQAQGAAIAVVQRISALLAEPIVVPGGLAHVTASVGIALASGTEFPADVVLRNADQAMYRAKSRGRSRFELFDEALQARAVTRLDLATALTSALPHRELVLHYQPIVRLADGRIVGAEALLRWNHPDRGLLLPDEFLDVAEESGLIVRIGDWVVRQACRDLVAWQATVGPDLVVAVNASARQLAHNELAASVEGALAETGLRPGALDIELTESTFIDASDATLGQLNRLRTLGLRIGLDDFGTGYASLSYLRRLPVDFIKIDRSFVAGLGADWEDTAIVEAIVGLARGLRLKVVAEGVERSAQALALKEIGCDYGQGWHVGRPQTASDFADLMSTRA